MLIKSDLSIKFGKYCLTLAASIAMFTALAHLSCIYLGSQCYSAQMAPQFIVDSAMNGTLLAPMGTIFVSLIFIIFGLYALSGAKLVRRLPLLSKGIYVISFLCIVRGILPIQLWLRHPELVTDKVLYVGFVWLAAGLLYLFGYRAIGK